MDSWDKYTFTHMNSWLSLLLKSTFLGIQLTQGITNNSRLVNNSCLLHENAIAAWSCYLTISAPWLHLAMYTQGEANRKTKTKKKTLETDKENLSQWAQNILVTGVRVASGLDSREKWPVTALPAQRHKLVIQCLAACHRNGNSIQIGSSAVDETHRIIWKMCAGGQRYMLQYCTTVNQRYIDCNLKWIKQSQHKRTMIRRLWGCECWPISPMRQNRRQWWPWHEAYYWVACTNQFNPKA
jgi:hypothetical protein